MAKKYYWLKLKNKFFDDIAVKKMRTFTDGDTYVVIYLRMQLMSLPNEGVLFYDGVEDDFASEMALSLGEKVENVRETLALLERYGLIEQQCDDKFMLTAVPEVVGKECESAARVRRHRAGKKAENYCGKSCI